jgi:hypothetical protein
MLPWDAIHSGCLLYPQLKLFDFDSDEGMGRHTAKSALHQADLQPEISYTESQNDVLAFIALDEKCDVIVRLVSHADNLWLIKL